MPTTDDTQRELDRLRETAGKAGLPESALEPHWKLLLPPFVEADSLADRHQRRYTWAACALYFLAATAVTVATVQVLFLPGDVGIILIEIVAMLLAAGLWAWSRRGKWHESWLHQRHLAERLRMMSFTTVLGPAHAKAVEQAQQTLAFYRGPEHWVQERHAKLLADVVELDSPAGTFESKKRFLVDGWIAGQADWHGGKARKKEAVARWMRWVGIALFVGTLIAATLHYAGVGHAPAGDSHEPESPATGHDESAEHNEARDVNDHDDVEPHAKDESGHHGSWLANLITCFAIVLPAWGAALHGVHVLRDDDRIAARYEQMSVLLRDLATQAREAPDLDTLRRHATRAEELMAAENLEWLASLSFHELELPT